MAANEENTSQTERVVVTLREMVLRGDFRPGERLAELTLVPLLNASRTPVRLALERLSHYGLLEALPNGGFRVREFTVAEISDSIEIRGVLEGTAARLAAERLASQDELAELSRSYTAIATLARGDMEHFIRYIEENVAFHHELWRLAKSAPLLRALEATCALPFAEPGAMVFHVPEEAPGAHARRSLIAVEHHRAILEAIGNRQGTRAEALAREHSHMARQGLDRALRDRGLMEQLPGASLITRSESKS